MSFSATIRRVSYVDILGDRAAQALLDAYAAECSIAALGPINPQADMYATLESSGASHCFGVYDPGGELVGFANVLQSIIPHYGVKIAVVESIYVVPGYSGEGLMSAIEDHVRESGCISIFYSVKPGTRFARLLEIRKPYEATNVVFMRSLA